LVNNGKDSVDDIDHPKPPYPTVGELIQNQFRIGLLRWKELPRNV